MLQQDKPDDFVIASGSTHSVREFVTYAFNEVGIEVEFEGDGVNEIARNINTNQVVVRVDPRYFRPTEVDVLLGNPNKAKKELNWTSKTSLEELVKIMVTSDMKDAKKELFFQSIVDK